MSKQLVPEIRIKGFEAEWEAVSLSDLMSFSNGINAPKESYGIGRKMISVMDILDDVPLIYDNIRNSVSVSENIERDSQVDKGDLVFVRSSEVVEEAGWAKAYLDDKYALYSGFSIRGKRKDEYDALFLELSINEKAREQIEQRAGGSTRFNINQNILNKLKVFIPIVNEQSEISHVFERLSNSIISQNNKLIKLKKFKQAMLQKMFPKEGEKEPEIRFEGFSGAWTSFKLGDVSELKHGYSFKSSDYEENGKYPIITIKNVTGGRKVNTKDSDYIDILPDNINEYQKLKKGDVLISLTGNVGRASIVNENNNLLNQRVGLLDITRSDKEFIYQIVSNENFEQTMIKSGQGAAQLNISKYDIENYVVLLPSTGEQIAIGNFFKELDNKTELEKQNLEKMKQFKKAMLQKMFV